MGKTIMMTKQAANADRKWHVVDVTGMTLGRAATQIAHMLRGKHKPTWTPHEDGGDFIIVVNASKIHLTGKKMTGKLYYRHTEFPGGLVATPAGELIAAKPAEVIRRAVWGMLPKGPLGRQMVKKLKIYGGAKHPHVAQQPQELKLRPVR